MQLSDEERIRRLEDAIPGMLADARRINNLVDELIAMRVRERGNEGALMSKLAKQKRPQTKRQIDEHTAGLEATTREGVRQAAIERQTVLDAAEDAANIAAQHADASMAKATFWERLKASLGL